MPDHRRTREASFPRSPEAATSKVGPAFQRLLGLMAELRDPVRGCPWTRAQTFETIVPYTIEEVYEVVDAIRAGDMDALCDELGDLLLQVIYHARMAEEAGAFAMVEVIEALSDKLVRRHPHVFAGKAAADSEAVVRNWERIKAAETAPSGSEKSVLEGVLRSGPALVRARKLQDALDRAAPAAAEPAAEPAAGLHQLLEELGLVAPGDADAHRTLGDAMFALVRLSRISGVDPEAALDDANARFQQRVTRLESLLQQEGKGLQEATPDQGASVWHSR
ncbi:MAG: nucleoside triphosphate pyrophosphohydrolase [Rhodospirillales bacterium]|nr:nucleoside triphosphate pyrophosphohydrolase [Rhodospirillales bacterium]